MVKEGTTMPRIFGLKKTDLVNDKFCNDVLLPISQ